MPKRNIKFTIQYDGTNFHGWQRQPDTRTVQGELERAIERVIRIPVLTEGASRTDAGVHALGQVANFHAETHLAPEKLISAVNAGLPDDAALVDSSDVSQEFSSRFHARGKLYRYLIHNSPLPCPLLRDRALHVRERLDFNAMSEAAALIAGERDYAAFGTKISQGENTVCTIDSVCLSTISWPALGAGAEDLTAIEVRGSRFLYKMVRTIAGTILEAGKGSFPPVEIPAIIESEDRAKAGPTLKPHGLYLVEVFY